MSLTDYVPGLRRRGKHDPDEVIRRLLEENDRLRRREAPANDYFALLREDVTVTNVAWEREKKHREHAEKTLTEAWEYIARLEAETETLAAELAPYRAAEANANATAVPPAVLNLRTDTEAEPAVRPLWEAHGIGGQIDAPDADPERTQEIPVMRESAA